MDRVTGHEVEFHLGVLDARQDGQAIVWVAVTMLLIVALFVAGVGIAQLMLFRWDAQGAADAAALAGANIQTQAIMSIAFLEALIYARNALLDVMYVALGVLTGICLSCPVTGVGCVACSVVPQLANFIKHYIDVTSRIVKTIIGVQNFVRLVFPFYASANATWFGWKNGALAVGIPLPLIRPGEGEQPDGSPDPDAGFQELSAQTAAISNCMQWLAAPLKDILTDDEIRNSVADLRRAYDDDDTRGMQRELIYLDESALRDKLRAVIDAIDQAMRKAGGCDLAELDRMIASGFQCGTTVTCEGKTESRCTEGFSVDRGPAGFAKTLDHLRQWASALIEALDRIDGCLDDKNNESCTKSISGQIIDYYNRVVKRAESIQRMTDERATELERCLRCMSDARNAEDVCRLEETEKGGRELKGLQGIFVVVWRQPPKPKSLLDRESRLWRTGQSTGRIYASAFGTPMRVEDAGGDCVRCLFQSVSLGPLQDTFLSDLVDILVVFFNSLLGSDDCEPPDWQEGGVLELIAKLVHILSRFVGDVIAWIAELFGDRRPDLCEQRPTLTRVDAGLTVHLGLTGPRDQINQFIDEFIQKYNEVARAWNGVPDAIGEWGIWDLFPDEIRGFLASLRLEPITEPDLTGGIF